MRTPIAIFSYNRVDELKRLIDSLSKCNHVNEHDAYIFSDGPKWKRPDDNNKIKCVRQYISLLEENNPFKNLYIIYLKRNNGCRKSVIDGLTYVLGKHGRVIHLEDDLIVSIDFLDYMDNALDYFKNDDRIFSISGFAFPLKSVESISCSTYLGKRSCSLGFGTWKERWNEIKWDVPDYDTFVNDDRLQEDFSNVGYDLPAMLRAQVERNIDSWAVVHSYYEWKFGKYTVFPKYSKVFHLGTNGTHTGAYEIEQQEIDLSPKSYCFEGIREYKILNNEQRELFASKEYYLEAKKRVYDKYWEYYMLVGRLIRMKSRGVKIDDFFKEREINEIAIYGGGVLAELLIYELKNSKVCIKYIIDRNNNIKKEMNIPVYGLEEDLPDVETVVITPYTEAYQIKKTLATLIEANYVSLEEII